MRLLSVLLVANAAAFQAAAPTGTVEGRVVDSVTGEPIRKANVTLTLRARPGSLVLNGQTAPANRMARPAVNPGGGLVTDANGVFRAVLPAGDYQVWAERNGYIFAPNASASKVTVVAGETARDFTIKMNRHGVIAGRVLDEDGEPMAHVQVNGLRWVLQNGQRVLTPQAGMASTNDLGEFRLFGMAPGKYLVSAQSHLRGNAFLQGRQTYAPVFFPGVSDAGAAQAIEVTPGSTRQGIDLRLHKVPVVRVTGKVSGLSVAERPTPENAPRRGGAMVSLMPRTGVVSMGGQQSAGVNPDGDFELPAVPSGSYILRVNVFGPGQDRRSARLNLEVGDRDISGLALKLEPAAELKGQIRAEGSPALTSTMVYLEQPAPAPASVYGRPDAEGRFSVANVNPEVYRVRVQGLPAGYYVKSVRIGSQDAQPSLDLSGGVSGELIVTLEKGTAELSGMVLDKDQKPAIGVQVVILGSRNEIVRNIMTDAQGRYSLTELPPGEYKIAADLIDLFDPDAVDRLAADSQKITLSSAARETRHLEVRR
jgi:hypothetical protein